MVSHEFRTVRFPDRVFGTSSIMPQKKNPVVLEHLKGTAGQVIGALMGAITAIKATNFTHTVDGNMESLRFCYEALSDTRRALVIVGLVLETADPDAERSRALVEENFSTATELADLLVRDAGLSFREAHHVTGRVIRLAIESGRKAHQIGADLIREAARELVGREIEIPDRTLDACLDPVLSVARRNGVGGPAETEVRRMIAQARTRLDADRAQNQVRQAGLDAARDRLRTETLALAGG